MKGHCSIGSVCEEGRDRGGSCRRSSDMDAGVAYNEGAVREYGWLIEFTEEGSSNCGSVEPERTTFFVAVGNKEIDLILNQYYLQARDPKVGAYCV